jgi:hypothetical protein
MGENITQKPKINDSSQSKNKCNHWVIAQTSKAYASLI